MTEEKIALLELLQKGGGGDFLRGAELVLQRLMEFEVDGVCAVRHERGPADDLAQRLPRPGFGDPPCTRNLLCQGSYFPAFLERCKTTEWALVASSRTGLSKP